MLTLPQYQIVQQLYESPLSIIYRGIRKEDNRPVILKLLKEEYASDQELSRRKQEYEIITSLSHPGIIQAYGIGPYRNTLFIVLEDFGGESLKKSMEKQQVTVQDFFPLALQLTDSLACIHAADVIHKDITPDNIILNQETKCLKIIDFGTASHLVHEAPSLQIPERLQGTLAYLSPEQTGRINRRIDYRTDLYSIGIIFYQLLSGRLPFQSTDALELIHAHIAKVPKPLYELAPHVPKILSDIVMKLLRKNADERYQSAFGVKADLEKCSKNLEKVQTDPAFSFPLAQEDISGRFEIPQKLYGREEELATLLRAFDRVCQGRTELMLVSGYSGVGKTALVHEMHKPMSMRNGYFLSGKFDQFQRNTPYAGIAAAYDIFCHYLLMENEEVLEKLRERIRSALGEHAQLLIDIIPTLELIIGPQPAVPQVEAGDAKNRFTLFFLNFVESLCNPEHPIILFLDDLQWADSDSLLLLNKIITEKKIQYLFIIGSYRNNEVDEQHPLMEFLKELRQHNAVINIIELHDLGPADIEQLLQDSLGCSREKSISLAKLIYQKTHGNAFFTHQFLHALREEKLLLFSFKKHQWQWDVRQIAAKNITDNAADLLAKKISNLPHESVSLLRTAACIGNSFDVLPLARCSHRSGAEVLPLLWNAMKEGLIQPLNENYKHIQLAAYASFRFSHDKIRQAAYGLLSDERKKSVHLQLARFLLTSPTSSSRRSDDLFDICWHFNQSLDLLSSPDELLAVARLNLQAGLRAKSSMAVQVAIKYLEFAVRCLPAEHWRREYELSLKIYTETIESLFLTGQFTEVERIAEVILQETVTVLDKIKVFEILIQLYMVKNQLGQALEKALDVLEMLGVKLYGIGNAGQCGQGH